MEDISMQTPGVTQTPSATSNPQQQQQQSVSTPPGVGATPSTMSSAAAPASTFSYIKPWTWGRQTPAPAQPATPPPAKPAAEQTSGPAVVQAQPIPRPATPPPATPPAAATTETPKAAEPAAQPEKKASSFLWSWEDTKGYASWLKGGAAEGTRKVMNGVLYIFRGGKWAPEETKK